MADAQIWERIRSGVLPRMFGAAWQDVASVSAEDWRRLALRLASRVPASAGPSPLDDPDGTACLDDLDPGPVPGRSDLSDFLVRNRESWQGIAPRLHRLMLPEGTAAGRSPSEALDALVTRILRDLDEVEGLSGSRGSRDREAAWLQLGRRIREQARITLIGYGMRGSDVGDQADECMQFVSMRLLERLGGFRFQSSLASYTQVAIRNAIIDFLRHRSRFRALDDARTDSDTDADPEAGPDAGVTEGSPGPDPSDPHRSSADAESPLGTGSRARIREQATRAALESLEACRNHHPRNRLASGIARAVGRTVTMHWVVRAR